MRRLKLWHIGIALNAVNVTNFFILPVAKTYKTQATTNKDVVDLQKNGMTCSPRERTFFAKYTSPDFELRLKSNIDAIADRQPKLTDVSWICISAMPTKKVAKEEYVDSAYYDPNSDAILLNKAEFGENAKLAVSGGDANLNAILQHELIHREQHTYGYSDFAAAVAEVAGNRSPAMLTAMLMEADAETAAAEDAYITLTAKDYEKTAENHNYFGVWNGFRAGYAYKGIKQARMSAITHWFYNPVIKSYREDYKNIPEPKRKPTVAEQNQLATFMAERGLTTQKLQRLGDIVDSVNGKTPSIPVKMVHYQPLGRDLN